MPVRALHEAADPSASRAYQPWQSRDGERGRSTRPAASRQARRILRRSTSGQSGESARRVKQRSLKGFTAKKAADGQPMQFAGLATASGNRLSRPQLTHRQTRLNSGWSLASPPLSELVTGPTLHDVLNIHGGEKRGYRMNLRERVGIVPPPGSVRPRRPAYDPSREQASRWGPPSVFGLRIGALSRAQGASFWRRRPPEARSQRGARTLTRELRLANGVVTACRPAPIGGQPVHRSSLAESRTRTGRSIPEPTWRSKSHRRLPQLRFPRFFRRHANVRAS